MLHNKRIILVSIILISLFIFNSIALAHCDSMSGPVVKAASKALETQNLNYVLIWIKSENEKEIISLFEKVLKVRTLSTEAKELSDMYFFETVVRIHRAGEGESYTGLKPIGYKPEEGIEDADKAVESGSIEPIISHLEKKHHAKVISLFKDLQAKKKYEITNINDGRKFVESYLTFIHHIEALYAGKNSTDHSHELNHHH